MESQRSIVIEDAIARTRALARLLEDETTERLARELGDQVPTGEINLLVVGQFKRGKSSLINALLGDDVMPTGALPLTGVVSCIRYGNERRIDVSFRHREGLTIPVDELPLYVTERYNPANRLGVDRVEVTWPAEAIRGVVLFDTPGIGSTHAHNTAIARAALPRADAAILVVGPEPPIGAAELQYAREVVESSERLFVVLNKSDIAGSALSEILKFTDEALDQIAGARGVDIALLSATVARDAQRRGERDPAFAAFVESLRSFVEQHGEATRTRSIRRRVTALLQRLDALLAMRAAALALPIADRAKRKASVERVFEALGDRARSLELMVDDDVRRLRLSLEEAMDGFHDRDEPAFRALGAELARESSAERRGAALEQAVNERASAWRTDAVRQASHQIEADSAKYGRLLGEIEASAIEAGCRLLDVDAAKPVARTIEFEPARIGPAASLTPTTGLELLGALATDLLPRGLREPLLRRRYNRILSRELDALRGKLRYGIGHDLEPWRRSAHGTISSSMEAARRAVLGAFEELADEASDAGARELGRVQSLREELRVLHANLADSELPVASAM
ncbi:MAG TPA: dynamin family protein [Candidatus Binatia bacterium]|nr:dynamin family protein [Candidatus Binatia bacterium]